MSWGDSIRTLLQRFEKSEAQLIDFASYREAIAHIRTLRRQLARRSDAELTEHACGGVHCAIASACEAARRALRLDPFDEQVGAALAMVDGHIAEMQTGEGKTLAGLLAVSARLLAGSVHIWTANDYLAQRDAEWMRPAYELIGASVASIGQATTATDRKRAYEGRVLYTTPHEVGFDLLRDQLVLQRSQLVQTTPFTSVLVDEADSILIDETRIPLVIAGGSQTPSPYIEVMAQLAPSLDYSVEDERNVRLTDYGVAQVESALAINNLYDAEHLSALICVQEALQAHVLLRRDVDYIVKDGRVDQVDEFKGRVATGRRWPADLQWAVEAKEHVPLRPQGRILGSITLADLVQLYRHRCGMTGTAATQAMDLWREYALHVAVIPPHKPCIRRDLPDRIFATRAEQELALLAEIASRYERRQPVLVGSASVFDSERLSAKLREIGIPHYLLNARQDEAEAAVIARAGQAGAVTISTNMAGRGTDIQLGEGVADIGGLAVIGTARFDARRIDNQLRGRAGRQGDPGMTQFFVCREDCASGDIEHEQRRIEGEQLTMRLNLRKYTVVVEVHRRAFAASRRKKLETGDTVALTNMDQLWAEYLELSTHIRSGLAWSSWTGDDPLPEYSRRLEAAFVEMEALIDEGRWSDGPSRFDRGSTWTYLLNDYPLGTPQSRLLRHFGKKIAKTLSRIPSTGGSSTM